MLKIEKDNTYNLCSTERRYREETLISYYFEKTRKTAKRFAPIDINGERYRVNLITGEITTYKKKDMINSLGCSVRRTRILMNMLLKMNDFDWFWTLTFDKDKIDRTNDAEVFSCYKKYIKNLIRQFPNFKYMCFPERHEDGCFHFHLLTAGITAKEMGLVNSGKVCCSWATKKNGVASREYFEKTKADHNLTDTDGEIIYNVTSFIYGYTTVSKIVSRERCNTYVKKYVEKALGSTDWFKKRFYYSKNLNVPDIVKKLVGAGFKEPKKLDEMEEMRLNEYLLNAENNPYLSEYNVLQFSIDNSMKDMLDKGIIKPIYVANNKDLPFKENLVSEEIEETQPEQEQQAIENEDLEDELF